MQIRRLIALITNKKKKLDAYRPLSSNIVRIQHYLGEVQEQPRGRRSQRDKPAL